MCVIMVATNKRPDDEMIEQAFDHNKDGAGIAWREEDAGETFVYWAKGLNLNEVKEYCKKVPTPYVVHFRIASIGGVHSTLTHPFPVGPDAVLDLTGRTRGFVLFHNGHWNSWSDKALDAAIAANAQIPSGNWSDSRAMAWMVNLFGPGFMEFLPEQKGVIFGPDKLDVFTGKGWTKVNEIWCSNDYFWNGKRVRGGFTGRVCSNGKCTTVAMMHSDLCWSCDRDAKNKAEDAKAALAANNETALDTIASTPVGGTKLPGAVEMVMGGNNRPLAETLTMSEAEKLHKQGKMSLNKVKKFRKYYSDLGRGRNKRERAVKELRKLSETVVEMIQSGHGLEA